MSYLYQWFFLIKKRAILNEETLKVKRILCILSFLLVLSRPGAMVLILDGDSEIAAHVRSNLCYVICLGHLIKSKAYPGNEYVIFKTGHLRRLWTEFVLVRCKFVCTIVNIFFSVFCLFVSFLNCQVLCFYGQFVLVFVQVPKPWLATPITTQEYKNDPRSSAKILCNNANEQR